VDITEIVTEEIDRLHSGSKQTFHPQGPEYFYLTGSDYSSSQELKVIKDPKPYTALLQQPKNPKVTVEAVFGIDKSASAHLRGNFMRRARAVHVNNDIAPNSMENQQLFELCLDGVEGLVEKYPKAKILYLADSGSEFNEKMRARLGAGDPIHKLTYGELQTKVQRGDRDALRHHLLKVPKKLLTRHERILDVAEAFFKQPIANPNAFVSKTGLARRLAEYARDYFSELPIEFQKEHANYDLDVAMISQYISNKLFYKYDKVGDVGPLIVMIDDNINSFETVNTVSARVLERFKPERIIWCVGVAPLK
jgi:hypothetical protein